MTDSALITCPSCKGRGLVQGFVMVAGDCGFQETRCSICWGAGAVPEGYSDWRRHGAEARAKRVARRESMGQAARRLGMSVSDYSCFERGLWWRLSDDVFHAMVSGRR